jgi:F-type H+-transporting ATPase subunit gamma
MANILDIRRRIRSVTNTRQITKAMKMVSAAKLRRAQERALAARPYAHLLTAVLKSLVSRAEIYDPESGEPKHPLLAQRPETNIHLIVVTGDKGLAGAFNTNILKAALRFLASKAGRNIEIEAVGRKGRDFLRRRYPTLARGTTAPEKAGQIGLMHEHVGVLSRVEYAMAAEIANRIIDRYARTEIDAVYLVYNEFKSVIAQRLIVEKVLPIEQVGEVSVAQVEAMGAEGQKRALEAAKEAGVGLRSAEDRAADRRAARFAMAPVDYIYEQPAEELFSALLPKYVGIQVFRALLESVAAEHAARMTAMDSATKNASDMIDSLTLAMNRARQAKITKEIIEIVSGAAALA